MAKWTMRQYIWIVRWRQIKAAVLYYVPGCRRLAVIQRLAELIEEGEYLLEVMPHGR